MADIMANLKSFQPEYGAGTSEPLLRLRSRAKALVTNGCAHAVFFCKLLKATRFPFIAKFWKVPEISSVEERWMKILNFAEMDKLTTFLEERKIEESYQELPLYSLDSETKGTQSLRVGIIGAGHIGKQLCRALLVLSGISGYYIQISTRQPDRLFEFQMLGVDCFYNNRQLVSWADVVFLCCLPSHLLHICSEIQDVIKEHCVIYSLVSTVPLPRLKQLLRTNAILKPQYTFTDDDHIGIWAIKRTVVEALKDPDVLQATCPCAPSGGITISKRWLASAFYAALNSYTRQRLSHTKTLSLLNKVCFPENFVPASAGKPNLHRENFVNPGFASSMTSTDTFPLFDLTTVQLKESPFSQALATNTSLQDNISLVYHKMMTENLGEGMPESPGIPLSAVLLKPPKALSEGSLLGSADRVSSTDSEEP